MALVATSPAALGVASPVQAPRGAVAQPSPSRPTTVASVRWVPFRGGVSQRCYPPRGVRMVVSRQGFPYNGGEAEQQQQQAAQNPPTPQQQQQQQQDQEGSNDAGIPQQSQAQQQPQQQKQWVGECGPCGPAYSDMLSPWFPAERSLTEMVNTADRLFGNMLLFGPGSLRRRQQQQQQPQQAPEGLFSLAMRRPWDVQEDERAYTLSFDLPGLSKEDVKVRVDENDMLFICADKTTATAAAAAGDEDQQKQQEESNGSSSLRTRATRKFQTQLKLPQNVQKDSISAEMKDGVLSITVPKIPPEELAGKGIDVNVA